MNKKLALILGLGASGLALWSGVVVAQAVDVSGIKVGEPFEPQRELVGKANPDYELEDVSNANGETIGVTASNADESDRFVVLYNAQGLVWFVARAQAFEEGARPRLSSLDKSLQEKYGKPSYKPVYKPKFGDYAWSYNRRGALVHDRMRNICPYEGHAGGVGRSPTYIGFSRSFSSVCGKVIRARVSGLDEFVSSMQVEITHHQLMYDQLKAKSDAHRAEAQRKVDEEKAKDIKPAL